MSRQTLNNYVRRLIQGIVLVSLLLAWVEWRVSYVTLAKYEQALEAAGGGRFLWNTQTQELSWDIHLYELCGKDPETYKPTFEEFMHDILYPGDYANLSSQFRQLQEGDTTPVRALIHVLDAERDAYIPVQFTGVVSSDGALLNGMLIPIMAKEKTPKDQSS